MRLKAGKDNQFVVYIIKGSTIRRFLILDLILGTGIYYVVKFIFASVLIASAGSIVGTEGVKRAPRLINKAGGLWHK
ncbi:hypothetical protein NNL21_31535 [Paenibacillus mendelii]|nr:hypothetical protein [Paenibacillus mendelii]